MKVETKEQQIKGQTEERPYTFKIIKKRSPWNTNEDEAIIELVNKHGTGNWTLIANEMSSIYDFKNRSGKQCRERWHNHLDPNVNKDNWSDKEESILFAKHMEYGNKWSDIAKYLHGRTDNAIKNHFYSKLRKYIRKILKQINKENLMKTNGIDPNKYNSDKIYKMLKKFKIAYKSLNKETIINLIVNQEKNTKGNKSDGFTGQLLKKKTKRTRSSQPKSASKPKLTINTKMIARTNSNNYNSNGNYNNNNKNSQMYSNFLSKPPKKKKKTKRRKVSICLSTPENKKTQIDKIFSRRRFNERNQKKNIKVYSNKEEAEEEDLKEEEADEIEDDELDNLNNEDEEEVYDDIEIDNDNEYDYDYDDFEDSETKQNTQSIDYVRPGLEIHNQSSIVIHKSLLYYPQYPQITIINPDNIVQFTKPNYLADLSYPFNDNTNPIQTPHIQQGFIEDNKMHTYLDSLPQISPMNINNMIFFPPSTRNMFNLDISYDNYIKNNTHPSYSNNTPKDCFVSSVLSPTNKEINLHNKIIVNEARTDNEDYSIAKEDKSNEDTNVNLNMNIKRPPQIDISLINQSEPNASLLESIGTFKNNATTFFNLSPVSAFVPKIMNDH